MSEVIVYVLTNPAMPKMVKIGKTGEAGSGIPGERPLPLVNTSQRN